MTYPFLPKSLLLTVAVHLFKDQHVHRRNRNTTKEQSHCSSQILTLFNLTHNAFWEISVQVVRDTSHPGNNRTIYKSPARQKHSQKHRWPSFLMSNLTHLPLIACWRLLHGVQSWAKTLYTIHRMVSRVVPKKLDSLSGERPFKPSRT